jgi:hypothetical protein
MNNRQKIERFSHVLRLICFIGIGLIPLTDAAYWITNGLTFLPINTHSEFAHLPIQPLAELSLLIKLGGFMADLIPDAFSIAALFYLANLFKLYGQMEFFGPANIRYIKKMGVALFVQQMVFPIYSALYSLILTISNPPGQRMISTGFGSTQIKLIVLSLIIFLLARIMEEGRHLQEKQAGTI